jgi:hypothetical protein
MTTTSVVSASGLVKNRPVFITLEPNLYRYGNKNTFERARLIHMYKEDGDEDDMDREHSTELVGNVLKISHLCKDPDESELCTLCEADNVRVGDTLARVYAIGGAIYIDTPTEGWCVNLRTTTFRNMMAFQTQLAISKASHQGQINHVDGVAAMVTVHHLESCNDEVFLNCEKLSSTRLQLDVAEIGPEDLEVFVAT